VKAHKDKPNGGRTIKASDFKATCLKLMDEVAESGEEIVITKNGRPVSRLVPYRETSGLWFGRDRDKIRILGDIVSPMPAEWFEKADDSDEYLF
jgi:prevent-host-death family protein